MSIDGPIDAAKLAQYEEMVVTSWYPPEDYHALRAENARLLEELAQQRKRLDMSSSAVTRELDRLRSWLRALEYRSPESVKAALRGDDAPEPSQ